MYTEEKIKELYETLLKRCDKNMMNGRGSTVSKWDIEQEFRRALD